MCETKKIFRRFGHLRFAVVRDKYISVAAQMLTVKMHLTFPQFWPKIATLRANSLWSSIQVNVDEIFCLRFLKIQSSPSVITLVLDLTSRDKKH